MTTQNKKQNAPGQEPEAHSGVGTPKTTTQKNYTPAPAEGQETFYKSLEFLPPEMREKLTREYQDLLRKKLSGKEVNVEANEDPSGMFEK